MINRKSVCVDDHREIAITTEQMPDGWGVVASVKQHLEGDAERVVDLPVPEQTFASEAEAEAFGLAMAQDWMAKNELRAA